MYKLSVQCAGLFSDFCPKLLLKKLNTIYLLIQMSAINRHYRIHFFPSFFISISHLYSIFLFAASPISLFTPPFYPSYLPLSPADPRRAPHFFFASPPLPLPLQGCLAATASYLSFLSSSSTLPPFFSVGNHRIGTVTHFGTLGVVDN